MENWKQFVDRAKDSEYQLARRRTYLKIDLDTITENVRILKSLCSQNTGELFLFLWTNMLIKKIFLV